MMTLSELQALIPGAQLIGDGATRFESISTDTRSLPPGSLYFALRGERFDGNDFAPDAADKGAVGLVVERAVDAAVPQLVASHGRLALGQGAAGWRARFDLPLIAVTGSNGKTTVTQMLAAILAAAFGEEHRLATRGNLNNDVGLPIMLFRMTGEHRAAVLELGMNHPGEIAYLAGLARPTVALVNNAQREHQEFMATVEATAEENGASIAALPADGVAVFPADDACAAIWRGLAGGRKVLDFALDGPAAVTAIHQAEAEGTALRITTPAGTIELLLPLSGTHNVRNALAATTAALAIGVAPEAIRAGLEAFAPVSGRGVQFRTAAGTRVIDDTYNANPDSVRAAIDLLAQFPAPRVLVLGDMGEVGSEGPAFHREIGSYARERGVETLLALGELCVDAVSAYNEAGPGGARHCGDIAELIEAAKAAAAPEATLLAKGSRFMKMERVVQAFKEQS